MTSTRKAYFVGGGIGSLAGAAFLIRDGGMAGADISIFDAGSVMGGSLDGAGRCRPRLLDARRPDADHRQP